MVRKNISYFCSAILAATMLVTTVGCNNLGEVNEKGKITLHMTHTQQPDSISDKTAKEFERLVEEKSNGEIQVVIYQNCGLSGGDLTKAIELVQAGNIDIHACAPANIANYDAKFYAFWLPFLFDSTESLKAFCSNEEIRQEIEGWCNNLEMSMLGINNAGSRQISSNKEIKTPEDLRGMNIRVPGANVFIDLYRDYFKANPTAMDFSEVYTALQQRTIDGQENPIAVFESSKFSEVQSNVLLWDGVRDTNIWVISEKTLDRLSDNEELLVRECASEALEWGNNYLAENEQSIINKLKEQGVTFTELSDEEKEAFKTACSGIYEDYAKVVGQNVIDLFRS